MAGWSCVISVHREAHEVVEDEDAGGARHDGCVDAATHSRRSPGRSKTEMAARERDDQTEGDALDEAMRDVAEREERSRHPVVERARLDLKERIAGPGRPEE